MPVYKVYRYKLKSSERSDLGSGETATEQARKEESESAIRRVVGGVSREEGKGGAVVVVIHTTIEGGKLRVEGAQATIT